jgi:hypothetical protein
MITDNLTPSFLCKIWHTLHSDFQCLNEEKYVVWIQGYIYAIKETNTSTVIANKLIK